MPRVSRFSTRGAFSLALVTGVAKSQHLSLASTEFLNYKIPQSPSLFPRLRPRQPLRQKLDLAIVIGLVLADMKPLAVIISLVGNRKTTC
jgi:hypothetical protein